MRSLALYKKYDVYLLDRARDIRQIHWTMKKNPVTVACKKYKVVDSVRLNKYPKYYAFQFDRVRDTRQNHWTMKIGHINLQKIWSLAV